MDSNTKNHTNKKHIFIFASAEGCGACLAFRGLNNNKEKINKDEWKELQSLLETSSKKTHKENGDYTRKEVEHIVEIQEIKVPNLGSLPDAEKYPKFVTGSIKFFPWFAIVHRDFWEESRKNWDLKADSKGFAVFNAKVYDEDGSCHPVYTKRQSAITLNEWVRDNVEKMNNYEWKPSIKKEETVTEKPAELCTTGFRSRTS